MGEGEYKEEKQVKAVKDERLKWKIVEEQFPPKTPNIDWFEFSANYTNSLH